MVNIGVSNTNDCCCFQTVIQSSLTWFENEQFFTLIDNKKRQVIERQYNLQFSQAVLGYLNKKTKYSLQQCNFTKL